MENNVTDILRCMGFLPYTHIVVRERDEAGRLQILGGGYLNKILVRYGNRQIERSSIVGDILFIDLKAATNSLN